MNKIFQKLAHLNTKICFQIYIETKSTPNPDFLKFIPIGKSVLKNGTMDITSKNFASVSPLATKIFQIEGITRVFLGADHLSISKTNNKQWSILKPLIYSILQQHFQANLPVVKEGFDINEDTQINQNDSEVVALIKQILSTRIRPTVQEDGGDIKFQQFDEEKGIVYVAMMGSCSGCPSSAATLKGGIEKMLKHYIAEVKSVVGRDFTEK